MWNQPKSTSKFLCNIDKFYFTALADWLHQTFFFPREITINCLVSGKYYDPVVCIFLHNYPCWNACTCTTEIVKDKQKGKCGPLPASASKPCIISARMYYPPNLLPSKGRQSSGKAENRSGCTTAHRSAPSLSVRLWL